MKAACSLNKQERGATMVEFALVCPVLLICILGYIDLARILTIQGILDEAVSRAANRALNIPNLDYEPSDLDSSSTEFKRLVLARQLANNRGVSGLVGSGMVTVPNAAQGPDKGHRISGGEWGFALAGAAHNRSAYIHLPATDSKIAVFLRHRSAT